MTTGKFLSGLEAKSVKELFAMAKDTALSIEQYAQVLFALENRACLNEQDKEYILAFIADQALEGKDESRRVEAITTLGGFYGESMAINTLFEILESERSAIEKVEAFYALGSVGTPDVIERLITMYPYEIGAQRAEYLLVGQMIAEIAYNNKSDEAIKTAVRYLHELSMSSNLAEADVGREGILRIFSGDEAVVITSHDAEILRKLQQDIGVGYFIDEKNLLVVFRSEETLPMCLNIASAIAHRQDKESLAVRVL